MKTLAGFTRSANEPDKASMVTKHGCRPSEMVGTIATRCDSFVTMLRELQGWLSNHCVGR